MDSSWDPKDQSALASSLQTAHNLLILPELIQGLVFGLSETVDERIKTTFDLSRISRDISGKGEIYESIED
jgi:conserved oligomeric Golgi complex subunit 5